MANGILNTVLQSIYKCAVFFHIMLKVMYVIFWIFGCNFSILYFFTHFLRIVTVIFSAILFPSRLSPVG